MTGDPREIEELIAIDCLQRRYGDVVTRRAWRELAALFRPDAAVVIDTRTSSPIELRGGDAVAEFVATAVERFELFVLSIVNAVSELTGPGSARGRMYICEVRQDRDTGRHTSAYGLYEDEYERASSGAWMFASRRYSSLGRTNRDLEVFPLPEA